VKKINTARKMEEGRNKERKKEINKLISKKEKQRKRGGKR
jgi:hypothetical protein